LKALGLFAVDHAGTAPAHEAGLDGAEAAPDGVGPLVRHGGR
jgi:hypothetical protein